MAQVAYSRCNGGHYFRGSHCPLDGWSSQASKELDKACQLLDDQGRALSVAALREAGVSPESMKRIIVVDFGCESSVFDLIAPEGYVVDGEWQELSEVGERFL